MKEIIKIGDREFDIHSLYAYTILQSEAMKDVQKYTETLVLQNYRLISVLEQLRQSDMIDSCADGPWAKALIDNVLLKNKDV